MLKKTLLLRSLALILLVLDIAAVGCSSPVPLQETGSIMITSSPPDGEIYLDNEYHGTTPATITGIPVGNHTIEIRKTGYNTWSAPVTVSKGSNETFAALLTSVPVTLPVTFATTMIPPGEKNLPQIHVDGYWTYPPGRSSTSNPVPLIVHTEAFNVGSAGAREVTVSANFYYAGRMICWNTLYLGTLDAGGHVSTDSEVSCSLPSSLTGSDLEIRFENLVVTP